MPWSEVTTTSVLSSSPASSSTFERPADLRVAPFDFDGVVEQVAADDLGVGQERRHLHVRELLAQPHAGAVFVCRCGS